jgi:hypothetical protein
VVRYRIWDGNLLVGSSCWICVEGKGFLGKAPSSSICITDCALPILEGYIGLDANVTGMLDNCPDN